MSELLNINSFFVKFLNEAIPFLLFLFIFFVFCSPDMPENEATFAITNGGITDAND